MGNAVKAPQCIHLVILLFHRIKSGEHIQRDYDSGSDQQWIPGVDSRPVANLNKIVHGVIFVVKANDPKLTEENYVERMKKIRTHFRDEGMYKKS